MKRRLVLLISLVAASWLSGAASFCAASAQGRTDAVAAVNRPAATPPQMRGPVKALGKGMFLVASERLRDPNFSRTVVLLLNYDATGALGLIINRPSDVSLASALPDVEGLSGRPDVLYFGGPVGRNQLFLLVRSGTPPGDADPVVDEVYASVSMDTLHALIDQGDSEFHAHAGYAGWGPGQLDNEVLRGDWYVMPADAATIFDHPAEDVWPELMKRNAGLWVRASPLTRGVQRAALRYRDRRPLAQSSSR